MARRKVAAVLVGLATVAAAGCSKLQASLDKQETVTLGDVAARVAALEQRVADLEAGGMARTEAGGESQQAAAPAQQLAAGDRAVVTTSVLNVRQEPDIQATRVGQLKEGAVVQVLAVQGDWAKVRFGREGNALTGWVARQFIERQE